MTHQKTFALVCLLLVASTAGSQNSGPPKVTIDFNLYPYQHTLEDDVDFTMTTNVKLPGRFSYFSYMNFKGVMTGGETFLDRSEQDLRYSLSDKLPLDLNLEGVLIRGDGNDFYQLGVGWRVHDTPGWHDFFDRIHLFYRLTFHLKRFNVDDTSALGIKHSFRFTFPDISERLYLSGYINQTFNEDLPDSMPRNPVVAEAQIGLRLWNRFYAIGEYRVNQRRVGDEYNFAAGIEYKFRW